MRVNNINLDLINAGGSMCVKINHMLLTSLMMISVIGFTFTAQAQPHSDNYILKKWAISSGGGSMSSDNYQAVVVVGQSSPPGISTSANYTLYSGFLGPIFGGAPGSATVWIWTDSVDVYLDWEDVPNADTYYIYRSTDPEFVPDPGYLIGSTSSSDYIDVSAVNIPDAKYFYKIICSN
jgi:hypothetical protein